MKEKQITNAENKLNEEIIKRLNMMEEENYKFAKRFTKKDYIITGVVVIICLILIIIGAYL